MVPEKFEDFDRQDIRVAVVMNGGVSLAVWMSGVALELHHLVQASRTGAEGAWPEYAGVLKLLHAKVRIDVIAGTSAGGLNGGFLALGLVGDRDLRAMRRLWRDHGALEALMRDPLQRDPVSLLQGDGYFLPRLREAYQAVWDAGSTVRTAEDTPVELILTGTLWDGRRSSFTDDMGTRITEVDYDATFRFSNDTVPDGGDRKLMGDLTRPGVVDELAVASRCTASFPGAFEPHRVEPEADRPMVDGKWLSPGGLASFARAQYVVDGGILLNKPIRPALEAVYRQTASDQVRRVLAYVVPDPGQPAADEVGAAGAGLAGQAPPVPTAQRVVLEVLTRLRSTDSVARELAEIRQRNDSVGLRRRTRDRLAAAMPTGARALAERAWDAYLDVRVDHAARLIGALVAAGQRPGAGLWSAQELIDALRRLPREDLRFIPGGDLNEAVAHAGSEWDWGHTTVDRLGSMTVDVLKRAIWLAPVSTPVRERVWACREEVRGILAAIGTDRRGVDLHWSTVALGEPSMPRRDGEPSEPARNPGELDRWLKTVLAAWDATEQAGRRASLYENALSLAGRLYDHADALAEVCAKPNPAVDPKGEHAEQLSDLRAYLLDGATGPDDVLRRMLRLDVVQLAFTGATQNVEQEVELVQVSSLEPGHLTGVQEHHFGAFYRPSWRMNDWLRGRMDAVEHVMRVLLSPERLRQLDHSSAEALERIREVALGPVGSPDRQWLAERWADKKSTCERELRCLDRPEAPSGALPACARQLALRWQTRILREELPELATSIVGESDPLAESTAWLAKFDQKAGLAPNSAADGAPGAQGAEGTDVRQRGTDTLDPAALWELYQDAHVIGAQRIRDEVGTDTFARATSTAAAVVANIVAGTTGPRGLKPVRTVLAALRGYALMLWAMVRFATLRSGVGANAVNLAVATGAALLAVSILVPGIPVGLTMLGVLLVLGGVSAAALRTRPAEGQAVGRRLLVAAVLTGAALAALLWYDWSQNRSASLVWGALIKLGVAAGVILLGWWVARVSPKTPKRG